MANLSEVLLGRRTVAPPEGRVELYRMSREEKIDAGVAITGVLLGIMIIGAYVSGSGDPQILDKAFVLNTAATAGGGILFMIRSFIRGEMERKMYSDRLAVFERELRGIILQLPAEEAERARIILAKMDEAAGKNEMFDDNWRTAFRTVKDAFGGAAKQKRNHRN